jgi:hypothetical protein
MKRAKSILVLSEERSHETQGNLYHDFIVPPVCIEELWSAE